MRQVSLGDVAMEDRELRRALAKASLRESWLHAKASGLDQMTGEEIEHEVQQARKVKSRRPSK